MKSHATAAKGKRSKGQVALEATFLVLFVAVAIFMVLAKIQGFSTEAEAMSITRSQLQGEALEMTLEGDITHLIRIDEENISEMRIKAWVVAEDCSGIQNRFNDKLPDYEIDVECENKLYWDTKY
jgi:hypothetical protein